MTNSRRHVFVMRAWSCNEVKSGLSSVRTSFCSWNVFRSRFNFMIQSWKRCQWGLTWGRINSASKLPPVGIEPRSSCDPLASHDPSPKTWIAARNRIQFKDLLTDTCLVSIVGRKSNKIKRSWVPFPLAAIFFAEFVLKTLNRIQP